MKNDFLKLAFIIFAGILCVGMKSSEPFIAERGSLKIEIGKISIAEGAIWIGIYDAPNTYLIKEKAILSTIKVQSTGMVTTDISSLHYGEYAIAVFHDINNNGIMDQNFLGIPSEPYAFSKEPKSKWRIPKFEEVKIAFYQDNQTIKMNLRRWKP